MTTVYRGNGVPYACPSEVKPVDTRIKVFAIVLSGLLGWMTFAFGTQLLRSSRFSEYSQSISSIIARPVTLHTSDLKPAQNGPQNVARTLAPDPEDPNLTKNDHNLSRTPAITVEPSTRLSTISQSSFVSESRVR